MKIITLTKGLHTLVDDKDYESLRRFKWFASGNYAARVEDGKQVRMHRELLGAGSGVEVDHINGNGLDNRRENLRICEHHQNLANRGKQINNTTGYKGVKQEKRFNRWYAQIVFMKKAYHLGSFTSPEEAALEYDHVAKQLLGEFAQLNFPRSA